MLNFSNSHYFKTSFNPLRMTPWTDSSPSPEKDSRYARRAESLEESKRRDQHNVHGPTVSIVTYNSKVNCPSDAKGFCVFVPLILQLYCWGGIIFYYKALAAIVWSAEPELSKMLSVVIWYSQVQTDWFETGWINTSPRYQGLLFWYQIWNMFLLEICSPFLQNCCIFTIPQK